MDATGHMDWPGAGPFTFQVYIDGIPTQYHTCPNDASGWVQLIKSNKGGRDTLVKSFSSERRAHEWLREGVRTGRLPL